MKAYMKKEKILNGKSLRILIIIVGLIFFFFKVFWRQIGACFYN